MVLSKFRKGWQGCVHIFFLEKWLQFDPFGHKNGNRDCLNIYLKRRISGEGWCLKVRRPPFLLQDVFFFYFHFYGESFYLSYFDDIYAVGFVYYADNPLFDKHQSSIPDLASNCGRYKMIAHTSDRRSRVKTLRP
jgi:hypothetical protein